MDGGGDELCAARLWRCRQALAQGQATLAESAQTIGKERDIGPGQCARLASRLRAAQEPVQTLLSWWSMPEHLPLPVRATRHALLVLLHHATKMGADLNDEISQLSDYYRTCSKQQAHGQRQDLLRRLDELTHCRQQILDQLDQQLSAPAERRQQPYHDTGRR